MKIALLTDTFYPQVNGVANTVQRLARALADEGHTVRVYTISNISKEEQDAYANGAYEVYLLPSLGAVVYPGERLGLPSRALTKSLREFAPDIIHSHTPFTVGELGGMAAKKLSVPLVGTHHTFFDHYLKHIYLDHAWARLLSWKFTVRHYAKAALVISPTQSLLDALEEHGLTTKVALLSNMLDTDFFVPSQERDTARPPRLVYMGRLSYEKSVDDVLRATAEVAKTIPNVELLVIGDGPERARLEEQAKELGIAERSRFTGYLHGTELVSALQSADIFLTASKSENMPLAILEAMAVGLPIIAVGSLGMREILKDGGNAFFIGPDQSSEMAARAIQLLQNELLRKQFAETSRNLSLQYGQKAIAKRLVELYKSILH